MELSCDLFQTVPWGTQPVTSLVRMGWVLLCTVVLLGILEPWNTCRSSKAKHRTHPLIAYGFSCPARPAGEDKKYFRWTSVSQSSGNVSRNLWWQNCKKYRESGTWIDRRGRAVLADDGSACTAQIVWILAWARTGWLILPLPEQVPVLSSSAEFISWPWGKGLQHPSLFLVCRGTHSLIAHYHLTPTPTPPHLQLFDAGLSTFLWSRNHNILQPLKISFCKCMLTRYPFNSFR